MPIRTPRIRQFLSATGDMLYVDSNGKLSRLARGSEGDTLSVANNLPSWGAAVLTTYGNTAVGASTSAPSLTASRHRTNQVSIGTTINATQMAVYLRPIAASGTQPMRMTVFSDSAGSPNTFLGATTEFIYDCSAHTGGTWITATFPAAVNLVAGTYWMGLWTGAEVGGTNLCGYAFDPTGVRKYKSETYSSTGNPVSPFGAYTQDTDLISLTISG